MILSASGKLGYAALAGIVGGQGIGLPLPGGTALIAAGALATHGALNIIVVWIIGVISTVVGSNIGYAVGRQYGTELLEAPGLLVKKRQRLLKVGRPLVEKYGWVTVLFGRSIPVIREGAPILAGSLEMRWYTFILWNTIGGIVWVSLHVMLGYFFGDSIQQVVGLVGIIALKILLISLIIGSAIHYFRSNSK